MTPTTNKGRRGWGKDTRCGRGHDLTIPDSVRLTAEGKRKCRECSSCWERERYAAKRQAQLQEQTA